jgi:hypothetical protein
MRFSIDKTLVRFLKCFQTLNQRFYTLKVRIAAWRVSPNSRIFPIKSVLYVEVVNAENLIQKFYI